MEMLHLTTHLILAERVHDLKVYDPPLVKPSAQHHPHIAGSLADFLNSKKLPIDGGSLAEWFKIANIFLLRSFFCSIELDLIRYPRFKQIYQMVYNVMLQEVGRYGCALPGCDVMSSEEKPLQVCSRVSPPPPPTSAHIC